MWSNYVMLHTRARARVCVYIPPKKLVWRSGHQTLLHIKKYNFQPSVIPISWSSLQSVLPILSKNMQEISKSRLADHWQKVDHITQYDKAGIIHQEENSITRKLLVNTHQKNKANQKTQPGHEQLPLLLHMCNLSS